MPTIRDRIVDFRRVLASELQANPKNWRRHPEAQRKALQGVLHEIGYADALLARETPDGLMLVDGHLRADTTPNMEVPVLVLDLNAEESDKLLATLDPLSAMAQPDTDALLALIADMDFTDKAVLDMLEALANGETQPMPQLGWMPEVDTTEGTALETVGYDLTSVWPRTGDEDTRVYPYLSPLPRQDINPKGFKRKYSRSPALEMERIVQTYMRPGDYFLEVCAGWWTFSVAACIWGYSGEGVDIWPTSLSFGKAQLKRLKEVEGAGAYKVVEGDAKKLPYPDASFDFVYCNPPFFQLERYSDDSRDLSSHDRYSDWLDNSGEMMAEMWRVAKPGAIIVTVMADYRKDGLLQPLHVDWIQEAQRRGLILHDLVIQTMRTEQVRMWRKHWERQRTIKAHEYAISFKKPGVADHGGSPLPLEPDDVEPQEETG